MTNTTPAPSASFVSSSFPEWVLFGSAVVVHLGEQRFLFASAAGDVFHCSFVAGEFIDAWGRTIAVDDGALGLWDLPFTLGAAPFGESFTYENDLEV